MIEKKKILYVITKGNGGGAQRYVYDLAVNLPQGKFEAVVALGNQNGGALAEKLKEKKVKVIEIEGLGREIKTGSDFKVLKQLIKTIREEKPDVAHLNSSKAGLLGSLAVLWVKLKYKNRHLKSIFTAHGWAFNEPNRSLLSKIIYYISYYWIVVFCNTTIAVSEKTKKDMGRALGWSFLKNKIKVVHNGIAPFETLSREEARKFLDEASSGQAIIYSMSELHPNKGIDVALRALARLPQETKGKIVYLIAGEGQENFDQMLFDLGLTDTVRFLGFVPDAKKLLLGCDIFLLPSRTEAMPYSLLEAGMAGVPTIATSVGGIPEVIRDMQNGILVHPRNAREIAEAIMYMLDHPDRAKEFGGEIKKTVEQNFSLDKMLSETIRVYEST